jgi:hypothetical protein
MARLSASRCSRRSEQPVATAISIITVTIFMILVSIFIGANLDKIFEIINQSR